MNTQGSNWMPPQASTLAGEVDALYVALVGVSVVFSILIAALIGRVDSTNADEFQNITEAGINPGDKVLIMDFEQVSYISSAGLRVILMAAKKLQKRGGKFVVCSLSDPIKEVFEISGFSKIIPTHASRSEALAVHKG